MVSEFERPDWRAPLDVQARIEAVPSEATVKGMFLANPMALAKQHGHAWPASRRYTAFRDYPLTEHLEILVETARIVTPDLSLREGLRRLGQAGFSVFANSLVGVTVLSIAGRSWESALSLVTRAYRTTGPVGIAELVEHHDYGAVVQLRDIWNFADCYHIGVFEAAMRHYDRAGEILYRVREVSHVDLKFVYFE